MWMCLACLVEDVAPEVDLFVLDRWTQRSSSFFPLDLAVLLDAVPNRVDWRSDVKWDPSIVFLEKYLQSRTVHEEAHLLKRNDQRIEGNL